MNEVILLKCGELVLKGLNRYKFEERMCNTIRRRLKSLGEYNVYSSQSMVYVEPQNGAPIDEAYERCCKVFGASAICRAAVCEKNMDAINETAAEYLRSTIMAARTFKVEARRSDKRFPYTSTDIGQITGGFIHDAYPHLKPQMQSPQLTIRVEIREQFAYVSGGNKPAAGGLPVGTNGKAMLLLSGGIDSPVAGFMVAKRGVELAAVHFCSPPYTSEQAKEKVLELSNVLSQWCGRITVSIVPFTKIQMEIRDKCHEDYFTLVMRRMMMRIAQQVAQKQGCKALVTGESIGQVASQTIEALTVTNAVCDMPVFRPVIGMDKEEIVVISRHIGSFETSILPYEDCCTVFTPKHPQTRPRIENVIEQERDLDIDALVAQAVEGIERVVIDPSKN